MNYPDWPLLAFVAACFMAWFLAEYLKRQHREPVRRALPFVYLVMAGMLAGQSIEAAGEARALISLGSIAMAAFFLVSGLYASRSTSGSKEIKFGLLSLMLFITFIAVGLGLRATLSAYLK
jgi:hypothetical protein